MSVFEGIVQIILTSYIIGFSIVAKIYAESDEEFLYLWLFFLVEISICIFQTVLLYKHLDYLFPQIIYDDRDYRKTRVTKLQKFIQYLIFFLLVLSVIFLLFVSVIYIINFSNPLGVYYLQYIQTCLSYFVVFYFFNSAFDDFSGQAYCEHIQSQNSIKIEFHPVPMTLYAKNKKNYDREFSL